MPLKIAYISDERFPCTGTDTQQVIKTIDALGTENVKVDFIQPRMAKHLFLSATKRKRDICNFFNVKGNFNIRDILLFPASRLRFEKLFHGIAAPLKVFWGNYDVIYTRNLIPLILSSKLGLPTLFETYRALPLSDPKSFKVVLNASKSKRFLGISTHSEYTRQIMIKHGIAQDDVFAIPNGFDPSDFDSLPSKQDARKELKLPLNKKIAVYTGHIRKDKGVHTLLEMAQDCPQSIMLVVGGSKEDLYKFNQKISELNLKNVITAGHVSINKVPVYLSCADVLILPPTEEPLKQVGNTVLPMKTFTYLAAGRPILAPDLPDTTGILNHNSNCLRVEPDNRKAAATALNQLFNDNELCTKLGAQAIEDSKHYTWNDRAKRLIEFIKKRKLEIQVN